jgi:hypothetical protein
LENGIGFWDRFGWARWEEGWFRELFPMIRINLVHKTASGWIWSFLQRQDKRVRKNQFHPTILWVKDGKGQLIVFSIGNFRYFM